MQINFNFKLNVNRLVKYFILSDLTFLSGWGLLDPFFAIFVIKNVPGATLMTLGIMSGIYWMVKCLQIPISMYLDKTDGEKDDFYALVCGILLASLALFCFMAATKVWHLYLIQFIKAIAFALYIPAWTAIFSRHLDKNQVAFEWALSNTSAGFAIGLMALVGGLLSRLGFNLIFLTGGFLGLCAALLLILAPDLILPSRKIKIPEEILKDHGPANIQK